MAKSSSADKVPSQHNRFIETAGQFGCDEDEKAVDEKLKKIAGQKPSAGKKPSK